jgi:phosphatidylinositol kinase/protein kinase (PI-3  family)
LLLDPYLKNVGDFYLFLKSCLYNIKIDYHINCKIVITGNSSSLGSINTLTLIVPRPSWVKYSQPKAKKLNSVLGRQSLVGSQFKASPHK